MAVTIHRQRDAAVSGQGHHTVTGDAHLVKVGRQEVLAEPTGWRVVAVCDPPPRVGGAGNGNDLESDPPAVFLGRLGRGLAAVRSIRNMAGLRVKILLNAGCSSRPSSISVPILRWRDRRSRQRQSKLKPFSLNNLTQASTIIGS
jgi:hypothetical protein